MYTSPFHSTSLLRLFLPSADPSIIFFSMVWRISPILKPKLDFSNLVCNANVALKCQCGIESSSGSVSDEVTVIEYCNENVRIMDTCTLWLSTSVISPTSMRQLKAALTCTSNCAIPVSPAVVTHLPCSGDELRPQSTVTDPSKR